MNMLDTGMAHAQHEYVALAPWPAAPALWLLREALQVF
jgi:hypothetical protein